MGKTYEINVDTEYAGQSDTLTSIPFGYVNKSVCGCGLTSLALENADDMIITVPNVELIRNKVVQYPNERFSGNILGVWGEVEQEEVSAYYDRARAEGMPVKIMVTYDSFWKVEDIIADESIRLMIDESDRLINYVGLKCTNKTVDKPEDVITYLLRLACKYKERVSFVSATPIPIQYMPDWVNELDQVTINWKNTITVSPYIIEYSNPIKALSEQVIAPLVTDNVARIEFEGETIEITKVIVFLNSLQQILLICRNFKLPKEDVAIICGNSIGNDIKIRKYNRLDNPRKLPKYTFVTSSGFQGIDLFDEEAMNVVVSCTDQKYKMLSMLFDIKQAVSRQRLKTNKFFNRFLFIYDQDTFNVTEEEIQQEINEVRGIVNNLCSNINKLKSIVSEEAYRDQITANLAYKYFQRYATIDMAEMDDMRWIINEFVFKSDEFFIQEIRRQYKKGFKITSSFFNRDDGQVSIARFDFKTSYKNSYNSIYRKYEDMLNGRGTKFTSEEKSCRNYKIINDCFKKFGKIFKQKDYALKMLVNIDNDKMDVKSLKKVVFSALETDCRYTISELKMLLQRIYDDLNINRKAKIDDLSELGFIMEKKTIMGKRYIVLKSV